MQNLRLSDWSIKYSVRRDLRWQLLAINGEAAYNVLDPLTRQSYRVGQLERTFLGLLDGQRGLTQVFNLLRRGSSSHNAAYPELTAARLLAMVEQFQKSGLIGAPRSLERVRSVHSPVQSLLSSMVVWQLRGLQPDAWLTQYAPHTGALFSSTAVRFWLLLATVTVCAVGLEFQRLVLQGSAWQWIIHPLQGSSLFVIFLLTRAVHELGHALVCKRHGIRCPDIGVFVILGAPCVYCDVSESWHLPNRWQRAAVAAAGMYVELIVASLAAWVWMLTVDGPVNTLALQTMFVCSLSTLLINANPLMRFDGYYLLSDLVDEPNLRARADQLAVAQFHRLVLGASVAAPARARRTVREHLLCLFSWSSWVYRAGLSLAIASMLAALYASWNLAWLGRLLAVSILASWWGVPSVKFANDMLKTARKTKTRGRLAAIATAAAVVIAILPIPYRQFSRGWVQPASMQGVYVSISDPNAQWSTQLHECQLNSGATINSGARVVQGERLIQLDNLQLQQRARNSELKHSQAQKLWELRQREELSANAAELSQLGIALKRAAQDAEDELKIARQDLQQLTLLAPATGRLIFMPTSRTRLEESETTLLSHHWGENVQMQRYVANETMLAAICSEDEMAVLPLDDSQLEWIAEDTEVRLRCGDRPNKVHFCRVASVVRLEQTTATRRLIDLNLTAAGGPAGNAIAGTGRAAAAYAAVVHLPSGVASPVGTSVEGAFVVPAQTLATLSYRWLKQNLRWLAD